MPSYTPVAGDSFILRGGDTWHFGNSGLSPYTGGTWDIYTVAYGSGKDSSCIYEGTQTGCVYWGVDQTWYSGSAWTRPILDGDNPPSTSLVASCTYQVANTGQYVTNEIVSLAPDTIFDNFELRGLLLKKRILTAGTATRTGTRTFLWNGHIRHRHGTRELTVCPCDGPCDNHCWSREQFTTPVFCSAAEPTAFNLLITWL